MRQGPTVRRQPAARRWLGRAAVAGPCGGGPQSDSAPNMPGSYAPPGMRVITLNRLAVLIIAITMTRVPYARAVRTAVSPAHGDEFAVRP